MWLLLTLALWLAVWQHAAIATAARDWRRRADVWRNPMTPRHPRGPEDDDDWMRTLR